MKDRQGKRSRRALRAALLAVDGMASGHPLAASLADALRAQTDLGPLERRAAAESARGVARELRRIDAALATAMQKAGVVRRSVIPADWSLLRYLALRVSVEGEPKERALQELALPGPRRPRAIDDAALARVGSALPMADALPSPVDPTSALALRRSVPDFLAQRLVAELGLSRADAVLAALNGPARLDLRANRLLVDREVLASRLHAEGCQVVACAFAPDGLTALDRAHVFGRLHREGHFEAQDEGSQLIVELCQACPGETLVDFCAGSGGKSLALAAKVGPSGRVIACDRVERRLRELPARARRARAERIIHVAGASPEEEYLARADGVLVDAPCSGVGGLRREVDLRWRIKEHELDLLPRTQVEILRAASRFVRPGGRLIYATCSPFRAENEGVVEAFLQRSPEFRRVDAATAVPASTVESGALRVWPDHHDTGAFAAAALERR